MTVYANTLNETFVQISEKLKKQGYRYHKKLLKVNDPQLKDFPLVNLDEVNVEKEVSANIWFFIREIVLSRIESEDLFTWKTFYSLELLSSLKSSIIVNNDLSIAMYLKWIRFNNRYPKVLVPDNESLDELKCKLHNVKVDYDLLPLNTELSLDRYISSDMTLDVSNEEHVIVYAKELTNDILAFFLANKNKTKITVIVDSEDIIDDNDIIVSKIQEMFDNEFQFFDPMYFHRHMMSNFSQYADLQEY